MIDCIRAGHEYSTLGAGIPRGLYEWRMQSNLIATYKSGSTLRNFVVNVKIILFAEKIPYEESRRFSSKAHLLMRRDVRCA